nr:YkgJ family cysteine cluster protein [uncultured Desulfuromonas sp.]
MWTALIEHAQQKQRFLDQLCTLCSGEFVGKGGTIHCQRGCAGCCTLNVRCTLTEAVALAPHLTDNQIEAIHLHAEKLKQIDRDNNDLKNFLKASREQVGPCPLLDADGACSVYDYRPLACRALLSTMDPHYCTLDFSTLTSEGKQAFMAQLDQDSVNFPTHYLAMPQQIAQAAEMECLEKMKQAFGVAVTGNLPYLLELEVTLKLSARLAEGIRFEEQIKTSYAEKSFLIDVV